MAGPPLEISKENDTEYCYLVLAVRILILGKVKCTCVIRQIAEEPDLLIPFCFMENSHKKDWEKCRLPWHI